MRDTKKEVITALSTSVKELQKGMDMHCGLLASLMDDPADTDGPKARLELCPGFLREQKLRQAIKEAIDVIDSTRQSFKSKQLGALRKKLTQVLTDIN